MGWLILLSLAAAVILALVVAARPDRPALMLILAAVMLAFAGYVWQGRPGLPGSPVAAPHAREALRDDPFARERRQWTETVGRDPQVLDAADQLIRSGDTDYAIGILRGAIAKAPDSALLWLGLGHALVRYADGQVTAPARYAYARASELAPANPAPPYFLGLDYAVAGDAAAADALWSDLLRSAPPHSAWRNRVLVRLFLLRQIEQSAAAQR